LLRARIRVHACTRQHAHQDIDAEKITKPLNFTWLFFYVPILSPQQQTDPKGTIMKLSKKNAERIATLYNSIAVAEHMLRSDHSFDLWHSAALDAVKALKEEFGITVVGYQ